LSSLALAPLALASLGFSLGLPLLALSLGCDENRGTPPPTPSSRINAVTGTNKPSAAPSVPVAAASASAPKAPRTLCAGQSDRDTPETIGDVRAAKGAKAPPPLSYGKGKWIWLNVWAAWCEPCKEEMPMLLKWEKDLQGAGVPVELAFVSIDDDEREMDRFLSSQPEKGVRASYWLREADREKWFESIGMDDTPQLPVHALVNPQGKLGCVIQGAVETGDFAALKTFFSGKS
jgi:thiol-disulfide isomerase/thioredoxin